MIVSCYGNLLLDQFSEVKVNTVNCVGVMGAGIAKAFKEKYPQMFFDYKKACLQKEITPGSVWFHNKTNVLCVATKNHWKHRSEIEWIEEGIINIVDFCKTNNISSIAVPMLGCSNGGLDKKDVFSIMKKYFTETDIEYRVYNLNLKKYD